MAAQAVARRACPPSGIRKFFDLAQTMTGVITLGVGEPDFPTPWGVREAAIHALNRGATTYTGNSGLLELRELICADLERATARATGPPTSAW